MLVVGWLIYVSKQSELYDGWSASRRLLGSRPVSDTEPGIRKLNFTENSQ